MTSLFTTLLLAHLLGDFPFQTNFIFKLKLRGGFYILPHVVIHVVLTAFLIQDWRTSWPILLLLGIVHFAIDWFKVSKPLFSPDIDFIIDQMMHLVSLVVLAYFFPLVEPVLPMSITLAGSILALLPAFLMFSWVYALTQPKNEPMVIWMQKSMCVFSQRTGQGIALGLLLVSVLVLI